MDGNGEGPKPAVGELKMGKEIVLSHQWASMAMDGSAKTYDHLVVKDGVFAVGDGTKNEGRIDFRNSKEQQTVSDFATGRVAVGLEGLTNGNNNKAQRIKDMFTAVIGSLATGEEWRNPVVLVGDAQVAGVRFDGNKMWWGSVGMTGLYLLREGKLTRLSNPAVGGWSVGVSKPLWDVVEKAESDQGLSDREKDMWNVARATGNTIRIAPSVEVISCDVQPGDKVLVATKSVWRNLTLEEMEATKSADELVQKARARAGDESHPRHYKADDFSALVVDIRANEEKTLIPDVEKLDKHHKSDGSYHYVDGHPITLKLADEPLMLGRPGDFGIKSGADWVLVKKVGEVDRWVEVKGNVKLGRQSPSNQVFSHGDHVSGNHGEVWIDKENVVHVKDSSTNGTWVSFMKWA